ncbi:MAG: 3-hydroxyacyl-CoA dehydrogenase/enoyl-CoA hydratase family protein [Acidobacteria bacterium]|nr:3-hydroxyacyl-CoA dehydrogenase/enoyl-CoA hydratase family protein [Acidobacteriota bacterium]NIM63295.1 3-hydroxyacyl-CoA dehydrogenase/enoyl-CoA hydratase family protein [Acidobacteriota bacterium]NIO59142.1 3-hydroxyacyl-CoA dehydrogenase/enoyl-CoA hydratase family protein [Acidobacteriota bacterium]NIQ30174.1 3-hydroxyacyl-CoA dehydrogenase/enoyl-CoA hydratase family protein [Acidobacteriota bacterium]NIQ85042.1 3-hydroxyacyl-CoA dehydrogenase/enoyl-CoA hydratase family protein [Acidobac
MSDTSIEKLAVIGAGNMGSGIAQKMATEGFDVTLVDLDDEKVQRGLEIIRTTLAEGVERKIFRPEQVEAIQSRIRGTADWSDLADVDLVVEAVFEDLDVKRNVFERLEQVCRPDAILATNTSSFLVSDLGDTAKHPERVLGLHYFYHPAKNRLVEVVPGKQTSEAATRAAWTVQELIGKTPIASADASGFVVNRFFVPWLNEAVRLLEEGVADIATIEWAAQKTFGVGMGPFELMNVTGVPIALHAATTLGEHFGPLYAPSDRLAEQVASGDPWPLDGEADEAKLQTVADRMLGVVFYVATALVDEGVSSIEDTDIGARVGLRWPKGPFELINRLGTAAALDLVKGVTARWELAVPKLLAEQATSGEPFHFELVRRTTRDGIATLTINRPDAMNALNEAVVGQLHEAFKAAAADDAVSGIVIAGAGKGFIAGADIRFFVRNLDAGDLDRIQSFTVDGHELLHDLSHCDKPVVARLHGLALGGGLELALACDRIVATPKAVVAFPETGIGIYPGLGGTQRTPRRVGTGLAKWLIYTGQMLPAEQALQIGLVDAVVPYERLDATIADMIATGIEDRQRGETPEPWQPLEELFDDHAVESLRSGGVEVDDEKLAKAAKKVRFKAPLALRIAEKLIDASARTELDAGLRMELDHLHEIFSTEDAYEGLSSLGRRRPEFKGR